MIKKIESFEDLECWKVPREIRLYVMELIKKFPNQEKYALSDGMRRSSRSVTENIAEGFGRYHFGENLQFCRISRGSLFELTDQFISAKDDEYITNEEYTYGRILIEKALQILNGYINYLQNAKNKKYNKESRNVDEDYVVYKQSIT